MEYKDLVDLIDCHQTWRLVYVGINNEPTIKWTYDLTYHLIMDIETIIAPTSMTYIVVSNAYELHLRDEKVHTIGVHYNSKIYMYTYVNDYM